MPFFSIDTLRVRGSVIPSVMTDVVVITSFSALVMSVEASHFFEHTLNIPSVIGKQQKKKKGPPSEN